MRPPGESARRRGGFALVLALTVMSLLVLIVLSLAGFLTIETRLAENGLQLTRARLNAIMGGRLALGHLQQEAGPDQRSTATGELAGVPPTASLPSPWVLGTAATERISQGRTRWTGVWRTDQPDQPPAWLISGKGGANPSLDSTAYLAQSASLSGSTDYPTTHWAPWQVDYPSAFSGEPMAVLVGDGSAGLDPGPDGALGTTDDIDLRVALPRMPFPGAQRGQVAGGFAYWIGDEGVKARVNLPEPRSLAGAAPGNLEAVDALRAPSRQGTHLLTGLKSVDVASPATLLALVQADALSAPNVPGYTLADPDARLPSNRAMFHDHTYWSAGVLADGYRGGLRRDLSLAFEMDDREFDRSEFGNGLGEPAGIGHATELYTSWTNPANGALQGRRSWHPGFPQRADGGILAADPRPRVWVPIWEGNPDNPERAITTSGSLYKAWSPVFIREDEMGQPLKNPLTLPNFNLEAPFNQPRRLVGPLWHLVRDYYRLYKEVDWVSGSPRLDARAFFPNIDQFVRGGYRPDPASGGDAAFSRYDTDNAYWSNGGTAGDGQNIYGDTPDPMGVINGTKAFRFQPRAVRGAYMPTLHRLSLVLSMKKVADGPDFRLKLFCTPVVALHNPYNVSLRLRAPASSTDPRTQGYAGRLSFSGFYDLKILVRTHVGNDPLNAAMETRGTRLDYAFGIRAGTSNVNDENFSALIPELTLAPGETVVLSSRDSLSSTEIAGPTGNLLRMTPGFFITGGFHTDLVTHALSSAGNPNHSTTPQASRFLGPGRSAALPNGDTISTWFNAEDMYWRHWFYLSSFGRQSRANDSTQDTPPTLHEVLGARKASSRASHALMINLGNFNSDGNLNFGDPGSAALPVRIGPMANIRDFAEPGKPPSVIGVIDTQMRVADTARRTSYNRALLSWADAQANPVPAPHPNWLFSNPLAQTSGSPGHIFADMLGLPKPQISTSIGNPNLRTQFFSGDELALNGASLSWSGLLQVDSASPDGRRAFGGASHGTNGSTSVTQVEVPVTAPLSIGQLMHANVSVWAWFPYHTVGNSFANVSVPKDKSWVHSINPAEVNATSGIKQTPRSGGHTMPDMAWLMNNALWDAFYFSGAAPRLKASRSGDYNNVRRQTTQEVLDAFAAGAQPLANPRMRLVQPSGQPRAAEAFAAAGFHSPDGTNAPDGHRRLAGYLLNDGALNVNSLSVEAWVSLLGSVRQVGLGATGAGSVRFPRLVGTEAQQAAARNLRDRSYWDGFVAMSDAQVRALAEGIVDEVRARARFHQRTERDQEYPPASRRFRGFPTALEPGTPFLGLNEFVNRFLGPTKQPGAHVRRSLYTIRSDSAEAASPALPATARKHFWTFGSGTLESAIGRADRALGANAIAGPPAGAQAIVAAVSHNWTYASRGLPYGGGGSRTGMPIGYFLRNVQTPAPDATDSDTGAAANRSHTGFGAPGCLFQGDLLQALGPALASRSDTFVIRAHGDGATLAEASFRPANAVLELVVQRLPEYLDARNAPEVRPSDPGLRAVNRALGRRFKVVSARWLTPGTL